MQYAICLEGWTPLGWFTKTDHISPYMREVLRWFHSTAHRIQTLRHTGSRPWCGGAYLVGRPLICMSFTVLSLLQCRPRRRTLRFALYSDLVVLFARSARNAGPFLFCGRSNNLDRVSPDLRHLPNGACSQFHQLLKIFLFRLAWVGSASE